MTPMPPLLVTLDLTPSWVNRAGRVDRSACFELRASQLRRLVAPGQWASARTRRRGVRRGGVWVMREAAATVTIDGGHVAAVARTRRPRRLAGDWRTGKSNAMRSRYDPSASPERRRQLQQRCDVDSYERLLTPNPNRGACRTKRTPLELAQSPVFPSHVRASRVRIERWRLHERLAEHYLICPHCGGKAKMLFLVQATPAELRDAAVARLWLELEPQPSDGRRASAWRRRLEDRYGLLVSPHPRCRPCLSLRYGEAKSKRMPRHTARRAAVDLARRWPAVRRQQARLDQMRLGRLVKRWINRYTRRFAYLEARRLHIQLLIQIIHDWDAWHALPPDDAPARARALAKLQHTARQAWAHTRPVRPIAWRHANDILLAACAEMLAMPTSGLTEPPALRRHRAARRGLAPAAARRCSDPIRAQHPPTASVAADGSDARRGRW